ncbi:MAG TPA: carboxylesterase family protein, partial [Fimbriimonadaceae bacterium]|nr:carboxylesterase family protein [Fimbriimonadaceae bacterium]
MRVDRREFLGMVAAAIVIPWRVRDEHPVVESTLGNLRGVEENGLRVFRGIPFAKPPVGGLRFRPPEPPVKWAGIRDATRNAPPAVQPGAAGSEDCLYLNVWAPSGKGPYPVLFWIHGGGNEGGGTAGESGAGFAREEIVVVTVAYRLGAFGFLELGGILAEYKESGDNGIRDLEAALRWVRENIVGFGGEPSQVTIAGQSAGAKDVAALMAAKSARGLFARAIMESGSGQTVHDARSAHEVASLMLREMGTDESRILTAPASEVLAAQRRLDADYPHDFPFRPFVGGAYLPKRPVDLVDGSVPLLIGTNRDESIAFMDPKDASKPIRPREVTNLPFDRIPEMEK